MSLGRVRLVACLLAFLAIGPRLPSVSGDYVLDDPLLLGRPELKPAESPAALASQIRTLFGQSYWHGLYEAGPYRPLSMASFALDGFLLGAGAPGRRALNLLLHAANVLLLFGLLRRLLRDDAAAALGAAFFAIHPIHGEVFGTVIGRTDLLATCFSLLALRVFLGEGRGFSRAAWTASFWLLALCSKESASSLPLAALALLALLPESSRRGRIVPAACAAVAAFAVFFLLRAGAMGLSARWSDPSAFGPDLADRAGSVVRALVWDHASMLWPFGLSAMHPFPKPGSIAAGETLLRVLLLGGLALVLLRSGPVPRASALAFWALLLPVANIGISLGVEKAPRFLYLPAVAAAILAGFAIRAALARLPSARASLALATLAFASLAFAFPLAWSTPGGLQQTSLRQEPAGFLLRVLEGERIRRGSRPAAAERAFAAALRLDPVHPDVWLGIGLCRMDRGAFAAARAPLSACLSIAKPGGPNARTALAALRASFRETGDLEAGAEAFRALVSKFPEARAHLKALEAERKSGRP